MKDKDSKAHFIHFLEKWFIIAIVLFIIIQIGCGIIINATVPKEQQESFEKYKEDYIGHWYDGTFFINMTVDENYGSQEQYQKMLDDYHSNPRQDIYFYIGGTCSIVAVIFIGISIYNDRKKKMLIGKAPIFVSLAGLFLLFYSLFEQADLHIMVHTEASYAKGFLSTAIWYPMVYNIFIIPGLLILMGLVFRQIQRKKLKENTKNNEKIIKVIIGFILIIGFSFILYRLGERVYELVMLLMGKSINIKLPFYYYLMELPKEFAISSDSYLKLAVLRFFKDLPVFIASALSIIMFVKIILSYIKNKIVSKENKNRYMIIFVSLAISSIILNVVGLFEVNLLQNEFLYQYKEATYTIAIRSLSEPLMYAFFIYLFKYYIESTTK